MPNWQDLIDDVGAVAPATGAPYAGPAYNSTPFGLCPCGHLWLNHDVDEYSGDGSETCCVWGCTQAGCPGRTPSMEVAA